MIREALQWVAKTAEDASRSQCIEFQSGDRAWIMRDGTTIEDRVWKPRTDVVTTFDSFCTLVASVAKGADVRIYIRDDRALASLDDDGRSYDWIRFDARRSRAWDAAVQAKSGTTKAVRRWLFEHFQNSDVGMRLRESLGRIDFQRSSSGHRTVEHGKESLGNSVEASVQGVNDIPEAVALPVSYYSEKCLYFMDRLPFMVDVDVDDQLIKIAPRREAMDQLKQQAQERLAASLAERLDCSAIVIGHKEE